MGEDLTGTWTLAAWRRVAEDGSISHPLGENPSGLLVYGANGRMSVVLAASGRPKIDTADPLGGDSEARADAYSTCLAYFGTYEVRGDKVVHQVETALFPNWSGVEQVRPFTLESNELVLRTPPMQTADGKVVNELAWERERA